MSAFREFVDDGQYVSIKASMPLDEEVRLLEKLFTNAGYKLYVVGGAVRDYLMHVFDCTCHGKRHVPKDIDLATNATPKQITALLTDDDAAKYNIGVLPIGAAFGVMMAQVPEQSSNSKERKFKIYEIATFRQDSKESDGRRPDFVVFSSPAEDAKRRDLTMNALFYDISKHEIRDYNDGQGLQDIREKLARPVGNPFERFDEDRLRPLRLIRFHSRYNNNSYTEIENKLPQVAEALRHFSDSLNTVSSERIRQEFLAGLNTSKNPIQFLRTLNHFGYLDKMFEGLKVNKHFDKIAKLKEAHYNYTRNPKLVLAWLLKDNDPTELKHKLIELTYPNKRGQGDTFRLVENVIFLVRLLNEFNDNNIYEFCKFKESLRSSTKQKKYDEEKVKEHNKQVIAWGKLVGMDLNKLNNLLKFERSINASDPRIANLEGKDISTAIRELETERFRKMNAIS